MSSVNDLLTDVRLPLMARIRQNFPDVRLRDPVASLREQFLDPAVRTLVCPGMSIAITAGSRGIDVYVPLLCELIRLLKKAGAQPFIIPAMGSHGRASAEGQQAILSAYGITEETRGAAMGIGMADITTKRLFEKMDLEATYYNCITSGAWHSGKIPMMFDNDRLAIQAAVHLSAGNKGDHLRMVRIQDTLHLGEIWISQALLTEAVSSPRIQMIEDLQPYSFDADGNLREWQ